MTLISDPGPCPRCGGKLEFRQTVERREKGDDGVSFLSVALGSKRLELLRDLVPKVTSIALLVNPSNSNAKPQTEDMQLAASGLGLHLNVLRASTNEDIDAAFTTLIGQ
jgi:ABC-type uncharacterized transport system substrate-binding protein